LLEKIKLEEEFRALRAAQATPGATVA